MVDSTCFSFKKSNGELILAALGGLGRDVAVADLAAAVVLVQLVYDRPRDGLVVLVRLGDLVTRPVSQDSALTVGDVQELSDLRC